ncbi:MAG: DUF4838 domain-containing protein [Lentisphaerae bacterium]|nr:DUF4838 domain-containing protein [Lentisphaerota bacterium]
MKKTMFIVMAMLALAASADVLRLKAPWGRPFARIQTMSSDAAVMHAADEFTAYMNAIFRTTDYTGNSGPLLLRLALAGDESCHQADELMAKHNLDKKHLGDEGFLVATSGKNTVMICAYSGRGVLNGVYKIIEKAFGVVAPRPLVGLDFPGGIANDAKDIQLPYSDRPAFSIRGISLVSQLHGHPQPHMWDWMARVGLNARSFSMSTYLMTGWAMDPYGFIDLLGGHSFLYWVPKREYYASHPEYFALIDGKRVATEHGSQITLGNPEVIDLIVRRMLAYMKKHPDLKVLPFGYNDTGGNPKNRFGWSEDPLDLKMDSPKDFPKPGSKRGRTWTTRYIKAANSIIERVNKVYPDVRLMVYAYHFWMMKPPDCPIHPNLEIQFAPLYMCTHHAINDSACPRNRYFDECLKGWAARSKRVYVREYYISKNRHFPLPRLSAIKENLMYYHKLGVCGFMPEMLADGPNGVNEGTYVDRGARLTSDRAYEDHWDASSLVYFTLARLGWNPNESLSDIVNLYCRSYYGPKVGPEMAKYFLLMDENLTKSANIGKRAPNDNPKNDAYDIVGPWCFTWNWKQDLSGFSKRLFMTSDPAEVEKTSMPLLSAMLKARTTPAEWKVKCRVDRDSELLKMYLLPFGYEIYELMQQQKKRPVFGVKGRIATE